MQSGSPLQSQQLLVVLPDGVASQGLVLDPDSRRMGKCEMQGLLLPSMMYYLKGGVLISTSLLSFVYLSASGFMTLIIN